ncbi:MAG: L,D-transpeptidase, partial [Pseudomonadota bacterium]
IGSVMQRSTPEQQLLAALDTFLGGDVETAMSAVETLVDEKPNFRLAHLVHGDMLASLAGAPLSLSAESGIPRDAVDGFIAEARQRVKRADFEPGSRLPSALLKLSPEQEYGIVVDLSRSRLYLFANDDGEPRLVSDYYVSGGKRGAGKEVKGDKKTPIGVYFVTSRLPGEGLPDKYGAMAFPVDYPNLWDLRRGRTGDGIWLHGVATSTYSRPPLDSDGCVAMSNDDLSAIADLLEAGVTPVVISESLDWVPPETVKAQRASLEQALEQWRSDWQSGNTESYLAHYASDFRGRGMDRDGWVNYKRQVNGNKQFIRISMTDVSMFA